MVLFEPVFRVRIVYKGGHVQDFDCTSFSIRGGEYEWVPVGSIRPLKLGADEIAAVWQIGERFRLCNPFRRTEK